MDITNVIIAPIVTEKATLIKSTGFYSFRVHADANKVEISKAVEKLFGVKVEKCRITRTKPKVKSLRFRRGTGVTSTIKKAYVKLKKGQNIPELDA